MLPPDIARLTSLKVLSVPKNQIRELPICLADMGSLQVIKFEGNPINFPPRDAMHVQNGSPPNDGIYRESDVTEVAITTNIKKYLRIHIAHGRSGSDSYGEDGSEAGEMVRFPLKRVASGRFPIKVNGADVADMRSPNMPRVPPIPNRSHHRGLSQQNTAIRRPSVLPLTIGSVNERVRSNSESVLRADRADSRQRRMGIVTKKTSELGTLDEIEVNNRFSHYRGLSHGSAMLGPPVSGNSHAIVPDHVPSRPVYVRRLSILPERRRESKYVDSMVEAAKGVLYSVFQIHPMVQALMSLTNDGSPTRSGLEIVVYNTNVHVQELEQEIEKHDSAMFADDDDQPYPESESIQRACQTLVSAYGHVCGQLVENIDTIVDNGDPRYIRTLLMMLYHSTMELRVTLTTVVAERKTSQPPRMDNFLEANQTIKPYQREPSAPLTAERNGITRGRNGTMIPNPINLRVATDVATTANVNGPGRSVVLGSASLSSATPRSGESFASLSSRGGLTYEFSEEDAQFERVYLLLQRSTDVVMRTLPNFSIQLGGGLRTAMQQRAARSAVNEWKTLIAMCSNTIQQTEILRGRLSSIKLKEPGVRFQSSFWNLCSNFIASWAEMAEKIKNVMGHIALPPDTRSRLRPIQQGVKDTSNAIVQSPWHHLFRPTGNGGTTISPFGSQGAVNFHVPITPQSAALGPAMQATVPLTPQTSAFAAAFHGNVFDRADALMANPGISMHGGRTLTRGHSGFNSMSSISSTSSDGNSSSAFSPNGTPGPGPFRANGGKFML